MEMIGSLMQLFSTDDVEDKNFRNILSVADCIVMDGLLKF